jgi:hypothetical protein
MGHKKIISARVAIVIALLLCAIPAATAQSASPDDTAHLLAGMPPSADSPLAALMQNPSWQRHARNFNSAFDNLDKNRLRKIRAWSNAKVDAPRRVLFYFFSGPDFLYANAFFPNASTYVLSGLEPVGPIPNLMRLSRQSVDEALRRLEGSLSSILTISFFKTIDMRTELGSSRVAGTLPLLYVFLARSGKTIQDVSLIRLDEQGVPHAQAEFGLPHGSPNAAGGVKIVFAEGDGHVQTLYYFGTNVANGGFNASGFAAFCNQLGVGDSVLKSASYLLHGSDFSGVRTFLIEHSALILQDDTGIPVRYFDRAKWQLHPFGRYTSPISLFQQRYQPQLRQLFQQGRVEPINFGVGYQWRSQKSNLLLAEKSAQKDSNAQ